MVELGKPAGVKQFLDELRRMALKLPYFYC